MDSLCLATGTLWTALSIAVGAGAFIGGAVTYGYMLWRYGPGIRWQKYLDGGLFK